MNITITPHLLQGTLQVPPSKSQAHRLLIAAALSQGESRLENIALSQDILATMDCMRALGATLSADGTLVQGIAAVQQTGTLPHFHCGESGSTLRFLIPIALAVCGGGVFTGEGRLMERPQTPYFKLFREKGVAYSLQNGVLTVRGALKPGDYALPGNVSSQFFTGLLYALPLLKGDSVLRATTVLESRSYLDMTIQALQQYGITIAVQPDGSFAIPGGQHGRATNGRAEGDWSQAAFYYAANGIGNDVKLAGMNPDSVQGDRRIASFAAQLAGACEVALDVSDCPDLVPPLAALAALRAGRTTRIINAARLRMKESDRLQTVTAALRAMGASITELPDGLVITGQAQLPGGCKVDACNDHRIAMMTAIAASRCQQPVTVIGAACVKKSYPNFWEDYERLGGKICREETE